MTKRQPWGLYVIAPAVLIVGLVAVGVPAGTVLIAGVFLTCPLMMLIMMRSIHGSDAGDRQDPAPYDPPQPHDVKIH